MQHGADSGSGYAKAVLLLFKSIAKGQARGYDENHIEINKFHVLLTIQRVQHGHNSRAILLVCGVHYSRTHRMFPLLMDAIQRSFFQYFAIPGADKTT
jgi:hypothetical protein